MRRLGSVIFLAAAVAFPIACTQSPAPAPAPKVRTDGVAPKANLSEVVLKVDGMT